MEIPNASLATAAPKVTHTDDAICAERRTLLERKAELDARAATLRADYAAFKADEAALQKRCTHPRDTMHKPFGMYAEKEWHCPSCGRVCIS